MVELAIVIPALDEQDNVGPLVEQVEQAVRAQGIDAQLVIVDDGSTDATPQRLAELARTRPWLTVLRREAARGQSAAMAAGIAAADAPCIATLDADLQNDPADLVPMLHRVRAGEADLVQGDRSRDRQDSAVRKFGSVVGRKARRWVLGDPVRDTGCSARVMRTDFAKRLPLQFKGMHRFIPAYTRMLGGRVVEMPVHHRPRTAGTSKYGLGLLSRGPAGLCDLLAVAWMIRRYRDPAARQTLNETD
ncbi:MAG: glycosyltransferase [Planctomycetes bacterium]|jgi:glycosyltransferase involved in cell wall biosynthesis|nr:glycosyltransferase [Planctomycetota bacterium]